MSAAAPKDSNQARFDEYFVPGTTVLRNKLGLTNKLSLRRAEYLLTARRAESLPEVAATTAGFQAMHHHLFQDVYEWAGQYRTANMSLGSDVDFADWWQLQAKSDRLFAALHRKAQDTPEPSLGDFAKRAAWLTGSLNRLHPFREGNGRTMRAFLTDWSRQHGFDIDFQTVPSDTWRTASTEAYHQRHGPMIELVVAEHEASAERASRQARDTAADPGRNSRFDRVRKPASPDHDISPER